MQHRMTTWWIRWEDLNWPTPDNLDKIKRRAAAFAEANVSAAIIFGAHFRWDYLPMFPLLHDYIAEVAQQLHSYDIKLFDHHSVNLVHRYNTREEMRHVMRDSGPHLPWCPTWEAAATWEYQGQKLNDWRMIDVKTGKPLYFPQYTGEGFCHRNPGYIEAYKTYLKQLIQDTNIDGLSADDAMYYAGLNACGCAHCRAELKRRTGVELPPVTDQSFWGNWDNPAWQAWLDLRQDATGEFYSKIAQDLPEGFMLTGCGSNSAAPVAVRNGTDGRQFLRGCNYVNLEMNGNTPPYKHDPQTVNRTVPFRLTTASHHQAAGRETGARAFNTGFAHVPETANICWAVSKVLGADAWIMALKPRLGLPQHILDILPDEEDIVGTAFSFEKAHPQLFDGSFVGQLGVYFSNETRNHTLFGILSHGYCSDFSSTLTELFRSGLCPHTVFAFPKDTKDYPVILMPSVTKITAEELAALDAYLAAGGKVIVTGPSGIPDCKNTWVLPNRHQGDPMEMFSSCPDGIKPVLPVWFTQLSLPECTDEPVWSAPREGMLYHPQRCPEDLIKQAKDYAKPLPVQVLRAKGYLCTMFETQDSLILHFLSEDYDTDIDHGLDEMRFHRSRVNFINKVTPIGIDGILELKTQVRPEVFTPFTEEASQITQQPERCTVTLPKDCPYAILRFPK